MKPSCKTRIVTTSDIGNYAQGGSRLAGPEHKALSVSIFGGQMVRYKENEWRVRTGDGAILVKLTQNKVAIVDKEDWDRIKKYTWCTMCVGNSGGIRAVSNTFGRQVSMHRVIMGATHGDGQIVDHINHNGLDNRRANLRFCTPGQSARNRRKWHKGEMPVSIYKGVQLTENKQEWTAKCSIDYQSYYLGTFDSEIEAAKAYNAAVEELHGEFACLNDIIEE